LEAFAQVKGSDTGGELFSANSEETSCLTIDAPEIYDDTD
jgi:hypothetical protein